jgi:hypothetical protein
LRGAPRFDPSSRRLLASRLNADVARLFVVLVALSALIGGSVALAHVEHATSRDSKLTPDERGHAAIDSLRLDAAQFDAFRNRLSPRQAYSMDVAEGPRGRYFTEGEIVRAFGSYYFLPAIREPGRMPVFRYRFR